MKIEVFDADGFMTKYDEINWKEIVVQSIKLFIEFEKSSTENFQKLVKTWRIFGSSWKLFICTVHWRNQLEINLKELHKWFRSRKHFRRFHDFYINFIESFVKALKKLSLIFISEFACKDESITKPASSSKLKKKMLFEVENNFSAKLLCGFQFSFLINFF